MLSTQKVLKTINLKKNEVARVSLMTHDEIVSCVPECLAEKVLKAQLIIMRTPPHNWGESLPLDAEGGFARNYSK
jgi:DNA polymerase I-like protein with 3'-5' exonuclease and polymerase domains